MSSEQSRSYLANLMISNYGEYPTIDAIVDATPKNNEEYPNTKADFQEIILTGKLAPLSQSQVSICIAWFLGKTYPDGKKIRTKTIFTILTSLNLVK